MHSSKIRLEIKYLGHFEFEQLTKTRKKKKNMETD